MDNVVIHEWKTMTSPAFVYGPQNLSRYTTFANRCIGAQFSQILTAK